MRIWTRRLSSGESRQLLGSWDESERLSRSNTTQNVLSSPGEGWCAIKLLKKQTNKKQANLWKKIRPQGVGTPALLLSSHSLAQLVQTTDTHSHFHQHLYCRFFHSLCCTNVSFCCISVSLSLCSRFIRQCHYF